MPDAVACHCSYCRRGVLRLTVTFFAMRKHRVTSLAIYQTVADFEVRRQIDTCPRHCQGTTCEGFVCVSLDAVGRKFWLMIDGRQGIYTDHGMNRWQSQGDITHVRGSSGPGLPFAK